jgi:hypothetical protein
MIDTHVHHWELGRFRYPWLEAFDGLRKDYTPADYRADAAEVPVDGWIHIQAEVDHQLDPVAETAWVESSCGATNPGPRRAKSSLGRRGTPGGCGANRLRTDGEWRLKSSTDLLS